VKYPVTLSQMLNDGTQLQSSICLSGIEAGVSLEDRVHRAHSYRQKLLLRVGGAVTLCRQGGRGIAPRTMLEPTVIPYRIHRMVSDLHQP
jgi:hypothetical protein